MNSISARLAIIYFCVALIVAISQTLINFWSDLHRTKLEINTDITSILNTASSPASQAIFDVNEINAREILQGLSTYPYVVEGLIIDDLGLEFAKFSRHNHPESHSEWISKLIFPAVHQTLSKDLYNETFDMTMGTLIVTVDYDIALNPFYSRMSSLLISSFFRTILVFTIIFAVTYFYITKPLIYMVKTLRKQPNDSNVELKTPNHHKTSEIGILVKEINKSFKQQSEAQNKLTQLNLELENRVKERTIELEKANLHLEMLATVDPLTNISNRRDLFSKASEKFKLFKRYKRPLSVIMLDIDNFKSINDTYGHKIGDKAIVSCVNSCLSCLRETDILGRIGGEEFAIILPESDENQTLGIAERIRKQVPKSEVLLGYNISMTVSMGTYTLTDNIDSIVDAIDIADKALYQAKVNGRNRVEIGR